MSDHVTMDIIYGEYKTSVLHTNVLLRDQDDHYPTEWFVFRGNEQLATGWGRTPREADERAKEALDRFRSAIPDSKLSPDSD